MQYKVILAFILFILSQSLYGQNISEIKAEFKIASSIDEKQELLLDICKYYLYKNANKDSLQKYSNSLLSSLETSENKERKLYAEMFDLMSLSEISDSSYHNLLDLIERSKDQNAMIIAAELLCKKAFIEISKGEFKNSILTGNEASEVVSKIGEMEAVELLKLKALIAGNLVNSYRKDTQYPKALEYAIAHEKITDSLDDNKLKYSSITKFIGIYGDLASNEKAYGSIEERAKYQVLLEKYLLKAYYFSRKTGTEKNQAVSALNMSIFYAQDSNIERSLLYIDTCILLAKSIDHQGILIEAYSIKADNLSNLNLRDSTIYYETLALAGARMTKNKDLEVRSGLDMAEHYASFGDYQEAENYLSSAFTLAQENGFLAKMKRAHNHYYEIYIQKGDYKNALEHYKDYIEIRDEIVGEETKQELGLINAKYQTELKEREIEVLKNESNINDLIIKRKNNLIVFGLLSALLLLAFGYYYFRSKNELEKQKAQNAKQKLLRSQLNPHFLFNALNSIQQFIYQKADPQKVADYLAKFSRLTRRILINSNEDYISLEDEIDFLRDYMDLQQIRFDVPFNYSINISEDLDLEEISIPPMFTQPFIENSIEHGILNKQELGEINISFSKSGDQLEVKIEDNGIGIEKSLFMKKNSEHRSLATEITQERIQIIEKRLRKKASLIVEDRMHLDRLVTGTSVIMKLPLIYS